MNNIKVLGSENKLGFPKIRIDQNEFEEKFFHNSITFIEYDNLESQLKIFFGRDIDQSENTFYPDLSIIRVSDSLREMYRDKLNEMATSEIIYNINK